MECIFCGKIISDDSTYCQYCGELVDSSPKIVARNKSLNNKTREEFLEKTKRREVKIRKFRNLCGSYPLLRILVKISS